MKKQNVILWGTGNYDSINIRYLPNHWQENLLMDYNKN